ncbi:MAG: OmpA family protein [Weeksellaceae bacterium]|jgi:K(+)-stimulated pyrophosphate-energized sodium pump|nr:OmpA family protein [Weeksellaceae bacterium]MDX9705062.1 OmpA family protein [Weeksellaceae bacterium]
MQNWIFLSLVFLFVGISCKCDKERIDGIIETTKIQNEIIPEEEISLLNTLDSLGNYIYDTGEWTEIILPDSTKIRVGDKSAEFKLYEQLQNPDFIAQPHKNIDWITLDRVYFTTGKSELTENSNRQIQHLVILLNAYPNAKIKIGGFTDNQGQDETNIRISTGRAKNIANQLIENGVDALQIESEGFGAINFVCEANDTDECKAKNRRVDIKLLDK